MPRNNHHLRVVKTSPASPLEVLWREFPQLKNAVMIARWSFSSGGIERTFRLLDGNYIRIGNKLVPVSPEEIEVYETIWRELGTRAIGPRPNSYAAHGIQEASDEFFEAAEADEPLVGRIAYRGEPKR
jgi:hypothetical protein